MWVNLWSSNILIFDPDHLLVRRSRHCQASEHLHGSWWVWLTVFIEQIFFWDFFDHCLILRVVHANTVSTLFCNLLKTFRNLPYPLDECEHGRWIIETYPIVAARLIKQCNESEPFIVFMSLISRWSFRRRLKFFKLQHWLSGQIEPCLLDFHDCAESQENRSDRPEVWNAVRKIVRCCIVVVFFKYYIFLIHWIFILISEDRMPSWAAHLYRFGHWAGD